MEANKLKDLLKVKSYFRYLKKGFAFSILLWILSWIIGWALKLVNGGAELKFESMAHIGQLSGTLLFALGIAVVMTYLVIGFAVEFVTNSDLQIFKWVNK